MKKINFLFLVICFFIASCGELLNDYNNKFGTKDLTNVFNPYFSYYSINSYGNHSVLMSFDFSTNTASLKHQSRPGSYDSFVVQKMGFDNNLEGVYFIERFSTKKSSEVTYLVGGKATENKYFPINLHALAFVKESIVGVGYDQGAVIQTSPDLQKTLIPNTLVKKLNHTGYGTSASNSSSNLKAILYDNHNIFVVSQGSWNDGNVKPYIYQLDDTLLTVKNSWPIPNCFNAKKHVNVIDSTKLVVSCDQNQNVVSNIFLIDISDFNNSGDPKITKILERERTKSGFQFFEIGGVSADRNSIFINEKKGIYSDIVNYVIKSSIIITNSYWYNLKNITDQSLNQEDRKTYVLNVSGSVIYNYAAQKYLFSCVLDNETSTCQTGKGAVSSTMDASDYFVEVNLGTSKNNIEFPVLIFD